MSISLETLALANAYAKKQGGGGGGSVTVDTALSTTSKNPVQNKVLTGKINEVVEEVDELKSSLSRDEDEIKDLQGQVFTYKQNGVYNVTAGTYFTTSTFSGWITDYVALKDMSVEKFLIPIKARSTAITKVRLFYGTGSYIDTTSTDYTDIDVNIPANTRETIAFEKKVTIAQDDHFFVGYACNQYCDMQGYNELAPSYGGSAYQGSGNLPSNSNWYNSYATTYKSELYYIEKIDVIPVDSIAPIQQPKLAFAELIEPKNLLNVDDEDQCKIGCWYYNTNVGSPVIAKDLHGQYAYTAVKVKVYDATAVTISTYPATPNSPKVYWMGAVDKDMILLEYSLINTTVPVTYNNLPENTYYVLFSVTTMNTEILDTIIVVKGTTAATKYVKGEGEKWKLNKCKAESLNEEEDVSYLKLPVAYDLVVGDTFQLFKKGIVNAVNPDIYDVVFTCSKGKAFTRFFEITPDTAETLPLNVSIYGEGHKLLDSGVVNLVIRAKATSPQSTVNVLCVGDSLTNYGQWPKELYRRLTANDGTPIGDNLSNINFIGTRENGGVHYEGYGGWTFASYNTANVGSNAKVITCTHDKTEADDQHSIYKDSTNATWKLETIEAGQIKILAVSGEGADFPSTGTLTWVSGGVHHSNIVYTASANAPGNPFWDADEKKVDFEAYCEGLGVSGIDYVFVLLGWNNLGTTESAYKTAAQTFIGNVKASYPNAKIVLMGLEIPARDGLANNYGANNGYAYYYKVQQYAFEMDKWYEDIAADNTNVLHINIAGQFDTENNMRTSTRLVNTRNPNTETYQSNGVHPAESGYLQIADAAYRAITGLL